MNISDSCSKLMAIYVTKLASKKFNDLSDVKRFLKWKTVQYKFLFDNKLWRTIFKYFCLITIPLLALVFLNDVSSSSKNSTFETVCASTLLIISTLAFLGKVIQIIGFNLYGSNVINMVKNNSNLNQEITSNTINLRIKQNDLVLYNKVYIYVFRYEPQKFCFQNPYQLAGTLKYSEQALTGLKAKQIGTHFIGNTIVTAMPFHGYNIYLVIPLILKKEKENIFNFEKVKKAATLIKILLFLPDIVVISLLLLINSKFFTTLPLLAFGLQLDFAFLSFLSEYSISTMKKHLSNLDPKLIRTPYKKMIIETSRFLIYMANVKTRMPYSKKTRNSSSYVICRRTAENLKILKPQHIVKGILIDHTGHIKDYVQKL